MNLNKKGNENLLMTLLTGGLVIIATAIVILVGSSIANTLTTGYGNVTQDGTLVVNGSIQSRQALGRIAEQMPNIALVTVLLVIVGLLVGVFVYFKDKF